MCAILSNKSTPRVGYIPVERARLYYRDIGQGQPIIVLHGGPDFDMRYLLPDLDLLAESFRLIYYDQRGRGRSADDVQPQDVTIESEMDDLDRLRAHFGLETVALLGHSWGGLLAMEYAVRHPERVSYLILMNTAPACHDDVASFKESRQWTFPDGLERMRAIASTDEFRAGDPQTVEAYYRIHFSQALTQPDHLETILQRLNVDATNESILRSREIEHRLYEDTWARSDYDLLPSLADISLPTLIIHGEHDFVPVECADRIAQALPNARLSVLPACGHFSYLERPAEVRDEIRTLFHAPTATTA